MNAPPVTRAGDRPAGGTDKGDADGQRVVRVMALPQRGHWAVQPAQVVPQEEQVEQVCPRLLTQEPLYMVQGQEAALL